MRIAPAALAASLAGSVFASAERANVDAQGRYTLEAEGIKAQFIPYGATLTNLFVKDKNGVQRDIVLGYDNTSYYPVDASHPVYNSIPGRYANRIAKGRYTIDGVEYKTEINDGPNTLHVGSNNWSYRVWNVTQATNTSITFSIHDASNSSMGMLGGVRGSVTYSLSKDTWHISMEATSEDQKTPIMLTQHTYFQLDGFARPDNRTIWNHTLYIPEAQRYLASDANGLPTGVLANATQGDIADFWSTPRQLGFASGSAKFEGYCGAGCHGYNGQWLFNDARDKSKSAITLSSAWSGIKAELVTDQDGVVLYSCNYSDGTKEFKRTQGVAGKDRFIPRDGCIAIEAMDYASGINHPEWNRLSKQLYDKGQTNRWASSWTFGTM